MKFLLRPHQKPRYLRFQYKPRFWDPEKERVEELKKRIKAIRRGLRKERPAGRFERQRSLRKEYRKSNLRLLLILIVLLWVTYKLLLVYL